MSGRMSGVEVVYNTKLTCYYILYHDIDAYYVFSREDGELIIFANTGSERTDSDTDSSLKELLGEFSIKEISDSLEKLRILA